MQCVRLLLPEQHCENLCDILRHIKRDSWGDIVNIIIGGDSKVDPSTWFSPLDVIRYMVAQQTCPWNPAHPDRNGSTALHYACQSSKDTDLLKLLLEELNCDLNLQNKEGNTPIHIACQVGNLNAIRILMSHGYCEVNTANNDGETPAVVALNHQQPDILRLIIREGHPKHLISLLETTGQKGWPNIVSILKEDMTVETPSHFSSLVDVVRFLVKHNILQLNCTRVDQNGNTALHCASSDGHLELVKFFVCEQEHNLNCENIGGDTPLHLACRQGNLDIVKFLTIEQNVNANHQNRMGDTPLHCICRTGRGDILQVMLPHCKLNIQNHYGDTPLHCACSGGHEDSVKTLLSSGIVDPTCRNSEGNTPLHVATDYNIIQKLHEFTDSHQLVPYIKVCVVGNHSNGKTTLVEVLQKESTLLTKLTPRWFRRVRTVESYTAGIVPSQPLSKKFGNIILYDFAGHEEYYSSHAAVLENLRSSSPPPLFIVLVKLNEPEKEILRQLHYWSAVIENHCKHGNTLPRVIVVGSYADEVKTLVIQTISACIQQTFKPDHSVEPLFSLNYKAFVPLDCRDTASSGMDKLKDILSQNCHDLQAAADISLECHALHAFLQSKFKGKIACMVSEIIPMIQDSDVLLPHTPEDLIYFLKTLSDCGQILLLLKSEQPGGSWVIFDKHVILAEVNGTIFAPENFKGRYKGFAMNTGVVPLSKIKEVFHKRDPEMITGFLVQMEFCQEIKDDHTLPAIAQTHLELQQADLYSNTPTPDTASMEKYFFFPALVSTKKSDEVWEDKESLYKCSWFLQCFKPGKFLTTRFLHVLLLRLAFAYALTPQLCHFPIDDLNPKFLELLKEGPVLKKNCSVWKSGIRWLSSSGVETIVEVREQMKVVAILMRCPTDKHLECECAELRSSVIGKILSIQQEFCPAVTSMMEYLIHPKDVQYPLTKDGREMKKFSVNDIAQRVIENKPFTSEILQRGMPEYIEDLLLFEPYLGLGADIIQKLFSSEDEAQEVTKYFLNQLASQTFERLSMYKKMINPKEARYAELCEQAPFNQVKQCYYLFQLWSKRGSATFKALRQLFDGYSIFHGRNPLELAASVPQPPGSLLHVHDQEAPLEHVESTEQISTSETLPSEHSSVHNEDILYYDYFSDDYQISPQHEDSSLWHESKINQPTADVSTSTAQDVDEDIQDEHHGFPQNDPRIQQPSLSTVQDTILDDCPRSLQNTSSSSQHEPDTQRPRMEGATSTVQDGSGHSILLEHVDDTQLAIESLLLVRTELETLTCWSHLGLAVRLPDHILDEIRISNRDDIHECLTDVVAAWLQRQDKPSWRSLVEALSSRLVNCQALARRIAETHSTSQETIWSTSEDSTMDEDIPGEGHGSRQGEDSSSQHESKVQQPTTDVSTPSAQDSISDESPRLSHDSSFQHDPETYQPTIDISKSAAPEVNDALLGDLHEVIDLLGDSGTDLRWFSLGLVLGLYYGTLKAIQRENRDNQSGCLTDTLAAWLRQKDAVPVQGLPSWKSLARALAHPLVSQRGLVEKITKRHQKVCRKTEPSDN